MSRILTTRRVRWRPGIGVLGAAAGIGMLLGMSLGHGAWLLDAAFLVGLLATLATLAAWRRLRTRQPGEPPAKPRSRPPALPAGKPAPYDLANDDSTKNQRYLM